MLSPPLLSAKPECKPGVVFVAASHQTTRKPPAAMLVFGKTYLRALPLSVRLQLETLTGLAPALNNSIQSGNVLPLDTAEKFSAMISLRTIAADGGGSVIAGRPGEPLV